MSVNIIILGFYFVMDSSTSGPSKLHYELLLDVNMSWSYWSSAV